MIRVPVPTYFADAEIECFMVTVKDLNFEKTFDPNTDTTPSVLANEFYYTLYAELHIWMVENDISYKLEFVESYCSDYWYIIFENVADAILFKLTWTGTCLN